MAEVSDSRPAADRLSWYLVFEEAEEGNRARNQPPGLRKLEVVTKADHLLENGWGNDLEERLVEWLLSLQQDGRQEWLDK